MAVEPHPPEGPARGAPGFGDVAPGVRRSMQGNRRRDTGPELEVRRLLHRAGRRFRVDFPIRASDGRLVRPDICFTRRRLAVFVDGCFWHGCPDHGTTPAKNAEYWAPKLARNRERDREQTVRLEADGWRVLRLWEHEDPARAVWRIEAELDAIR